MEKELLEEMIDERIEFDETLYEKNVKENGELFHETEDGFGEAIGEQEETEE